MAIEKLLISPGVSFTLTDLTFNTTTPVGRTSACVVGEFPKGRAFEPIPVNNFGLMRSLFGDPDGCKFTDSQHI